MREEHKKITDLEIENSELKREIEKLQNQIIDEAKKVVEDYAKNPSDMSGSLIRIHQDSPFLDEKNVDKKK